MTTAFLLTCHGTVDRTEDIPAFLANIRRGRPTPQEIVDEVTHRFERIGGSPLMRITAEQGAALEARLGVRVAIAGRLWKPYPAEVVDRLVADGATTIVSLPLAPQSVAVYHEAVRAALGDRPGVRLVEVPPWGDEPILHDAFVEAILEALARFPVLAPSPSAPLGESRRDVPVVLTAHSLPQRIIDMGDPYEAQFRAMAEHVGRRVFERGNEVRVAFQSQGMTGDRWLGPDLTTTLRELGERGTKAAVIAPIGFLADHVETLYDIDIEARETARGFGIERLERMPAMNTRPRFIDALEAVARRALDGSSS